MTAISAEPLLVDTSTAVALLVADHEHHRATLQALAGATLGLSGHAAFETYSVLTRLPAPARVTPAAALRLVSVNFPETRHLSSDRAATVLSELPGLGVAGGSVYDALVAATAVEHGLVLVTRDRRALETYRVLGAHVRLLP